MGAVTTSGSLYPFQTSRLIIPITDLAFAGSAFSRDELSLKSPDWTTMPHARHFLRLAHLLVSD